MQIPTGIVQFNLYLTGRKKLLCSHSGPYQPLAPLTHTSDSVYTPHLVARELTAQARCTSSVSKNRPEFNKVVTQGECLTEGEFTELSKLHLTVNVLVTGEELKTQDHTLFGSSRFNWICGCSS